MKTKIVYVVASLNDDIYMEQAIVSAWSARYYNPDCQIEMVCDQDTFSTLSSGIRSQYKTLFNNIHVRDFLPEQSMVERSRWLKTTLREVIEGDFLYLDTDTVVCADLSYVDEFDFDLGMTLDFNCEFSKCIVYGWVVPQMKEMYGLDVSNEKHYFNSGVAFVRDCQNTRDFYKQWNEQWVHSLQNFHRMKDQQPLMKTNIDMGYVITELPGNLNCQVEVSIQYLYTAHVMHFYNALFGKYNELSPFCKELYLQVKENGLSEESKKIILNCKSSFNSPSIPLPLEAALLWRRSLSSRDFDNTLKSSNSYYTISFIWQKYPRIMRIIESILGTMIRLHHGKK